MNYKKLVRVTDAVTSSKDLSQESNGFLDCIKVLSPERGGSGNERIINGNVYKFDLKTWKDGFESLGDEKGGRPTYQEFLDWLNETQLKEGVSVEESASKYGEYKTSREAEVSTAQKQKQLIKSHRAEFENACDDLYYGYGFRFWFNSCNGSMSEEDAKILWKAAVTKMGDED